MRLKFLGGAQTVTGASFLLTSDQSKVLIDCGLFQGQGEDRNYRDFKFDPSELDAVLVTHAHLDHVGRIPKLVKQGFQGKILSTAPTKPLASIILKDSYKIMKQEGKEELFDREDIEQALEQWETVDFNERRELTSGFDFRLRTSGHVLGSAIVEIWKDDKKIVFSGDLGSSPTPLVKDPQIIDQADYVVMESVYGDRFHEDREQRKELLENIIENTISSKGTLMIPSFALERTQQLLYEFNSLVENKRVPQVPVFMDSPMAIEILPVYEEFNHLFDQRAGQLIKQGDRLFDFPGLELTESVQQSKRINEVDPPKIVIAGSGMSTGGRILHHEKRYLPDSDSCLLFVCYQVEGTLGRKIQEGAEQVEILGDQIPIRAKIRTIDGYSNHADQPQLLSWLRNMDSRPEKVFITQGEQQSSRSLSQAIRDHLGISTEIPELHQQVEI